MRDVAHEPRDAGEGGMVGSAEEKVTIRDVGVTVQRDEPRDTGAEICFLVREQLFDTKIASFPKPLY